MTRQLIFKVAKSSKIAERESKVMRVTGGFYNLIQELSEETNLPKVRIMEQITDFLTDNILIREDGND